MLNSVVCSKLESCLSYALRRIGADDLLPIDYDQIMSGNDFRILGFDRQVVTIGDIILWDKDIQRSLMPIEITKDCLIVSAYLVTGLHYAVSEGNGLFSDCVRENDYPVIRLRKMDDVRPDKLLRRITGR